MNVSEEIKRLHELHQAGALSDAEFAQAKAKLLSNINLDKPDSTSGAGADAAPVRRTTWCRNSTACAVRATTAGSAASAAAWAALPAWKRGSGAWSSSCLH